MRHLRRRAEDGQALVLVLVFLVLFGVVAGLLLNQTSSSFVLNIATQDQSKLLYGADAGVEWGIHQLGSNSQCPTSVWPSPTTPTAAVTAGVRVPGITKVTVSCIQATGPGSNLFGGYAVVTGVGYPSTRTQSGSVASHEGTTTCTSISVDPIDPGKPTDGGGKPTCVTYPSTSGTPPPTWTNVAATASPAPNTKTKQQHDVFSLGVHAVYSVGNHATGRERIWFYNGDDFTPVTTATDVFKHTGGLLTGANLNGVWATASGATGATAEVFAVGATGPNGVLLRCTASCTSATAAWVDQLGPGTMALADVYGTGASAVYAVGNAAGKTGPETVLAYDGTSWQRVTAPGGAGGKANLKGVFAAGADVWAVGATGANGQVLLCTTSCTSSGSTWANVTPPGAKALTAVTGVTVTGTPYLWAVGNAFVMTCTAGCATATPTWATQTLAGDNLADVAAGDATHVWAVGAKSKIVFCGATCTAGTETWTAQRVPAGTPQLNGVATASPPTTATHDWSGHVWAVGNNVGATGTFFDYTPVTASNIPVVAKISGGPVFNAQGTNLVNGLEVAANYTQELTTCPTPYTAPANLHVDSPHTAKCTTTLPQSLVTLNRKFPGWSATGAYAANGPPPPAGSKTTLHTPTLTNDPLCKNLVVYTPGTYAQKIGFAKTTTYFFESGLYYFTGGFGAFDNGTNGTDNLYVIGGMPSVGDHDTIAHNSPCWKYIETKYAHAGTGTGVEWILGGGTWMDVHTVNLELFTREGGKRWEGAQGLSIREVPPACTTTGQASPGPGPSCLTATQVNEGWKPSAGGGLSQLFQVDANQHLPQVFVHGGLYLPDNNVEEFVNTYAVVLGPIDCNSLELSFESRTSPELRIEAGTGTPTVALVATAYGPGSPFQEEAIWGVTPSNPGTPPKILNWWVVARS